MGDISFRKKEELITRGWKKRREEEFDVAHGNNSKRQRRGRLDVVALCGTGHRLQCLINHFSCSVELFPFLLITNRTTDCE